MFAVLLVLLAQTAKVPLTSAKALYSEGRLRSQQASETYRQLFGKISPDSPFALAVDGEKLMSRQQYRRAFTLFREALRKDPDLLSARSALVEIYRADRHPEWAHAEQSAMASVDCAAHHLACETLASRYDAVLAATQSDTRPEALYWRAQAYTGLAYQAFTQLDRLPDSPELHRFKAGLYHEAGRRAQVVEELRKAIALAPDDRELRRDLAMALGAQGDFSAAYRLGRQLLRDQPNSAELNALVGDALLNRQEAAQSIPFFRKALAADPEAAATHASLAKALMQTGAVKEALSHLQSALPGDRDGSVHYQLAKAYSQTGQAARAAAAMKEYEQLSAKATPPPEPEITSP